MNVKILYTVVILPLLLLILTWVYNIMVYGRADTRPRNVLIADEKFFKLPILSNIFGSIWYTVSNETKKLVKSATGMAIEALSVIGFLYIFYGFSKYFNTKNPNYAAGRPFIFIGVCLSIFAIRRLVEPNELPFINDGSARIETLDLILMSMFGLLFGSYVYYVFLPKYIQNHAYGKLFIVLSFCIGAILGFTINFRSNIEFFGQDNFNDGLNVGIISVLSMGIIYMRFFRGLKDHNLFFLLLTTFIIGFGAGLIEIKKQIKIMYQEQRIPVSTIYIILATYLGLNLAGISGALQFFIWTYIETSAYSLIYYTPVLNRLSPYVYMVSFFDIDEDGAINDSIFSEGASTRTFEAGTKRR